MSGASFWKCLASLAMSAAALASSSAQRSMSITPALFLLCAVSLSACATHWSGPTSTRDKSGRLVCVLHRCPLQHRIGYRYDGVFEPIDDGRHRYPNPWPVAVDTKKSKDFCLPEQVTYCDTCNLKAGLGRID